MRKAYSPPRVIDTRRINPEHLTELQSSGIDLLTGGFAGVYSLSHENAYDLGIRSSPTTDLAGLCYRYWDPIEKCFSDRFVRIKPRIQVDGRKYLQPKGEKPKVYFLAGTTRADLEDIQKPVFVTEGEKKALALDFAARAKGITALLLAIGGVWGWRFSPKALQPDGILGKGKSRAIPDLDLITWSGRKAFLFFDSDVVINWKVATAEKALAEELTRRGASVHLTRFGEEA